MSKLNYPLKIADVKSGLSLRSSDKERPIFK